MTFLNLKIDNLYLNWTIHIHKPKNIRKCLAKDEFAQQKELRYSRLHSPACKSGEQSADLFPSQIPSKLASIFAIELIKNLYLSIKYLQNLENAKS